MIVGDVADSFPVNSPGLVTPTRTITPGQPGEHELTAKVTDTEGATATVESRFTVEILEPRWLRVGFDSNPNMIDLQVPSQVSSQQGSFTSCTASAGSIVIRSFNQKTDGTFLSDVTWTWTFKPPPAVLKLEQAKQIALTGSSDGTIVAGGIGLSLAEYQFGFPITLEGQTEPVFPNFNGFSLVLRLSGPDQEDVHTTATVRFGLPGTVAKIRLSATGHIGGGCAVDWLYKWTTP